MSPRIAKGIWIAIVICAALLGAYRLDEVPPGLHSDEAVGAYEAHCIAETWADCHGRPHPVFIQSAEDYLEGFFVYALSLVDRFRPCDETALRLAVVAIFLFTGYALRLLGGALFGEAAGLCAAGAFFITPWAFVLSRQIIRPLTCLPFLLLGLWAAVRFAREKKARHALAAGAFIGLSLHTYLVSRLFAPLILFGFPIGLAAAKDRAWRKFLVFALPVFFIIVSPILVSLFSDRQAALERMGQVSIFKDEVAKDFVSRHGGTVNLLVWPRMFASRYASNIGIDFLFRKGDPNLRHALPGRGQLFWAQIPFILAGLAFLVISRRKSDWAIVGLWWLAYPIPAALSVGSSGDGLFAGGHAYRALAGAPLFALLTGLGLARVLEMIFDKKERYHRALREIAGTTLAMLLCWYGYAAHQWFHYYYYEYAKISGPVFGGTSQKAMPAAVLLGGSRKYVLVKDFPMGFPDYYAAFYSKFDPAKFEERIKRRHVHDLTEPIGPFADYSVFQKTDETYAILTPKKFPGVPLMVFKDAGGKDNLYIYDKLSSVKPIRAWELCGPFPLPAGGTAEELRKTEYPKDLVARCDAEGMWKKVVGREDYIDLWDAVSHEPASWRLRGRANGWAGPGGMVSLFVGSDDGALMWVDGRPVYHSSAPDRSFILDQDVVNVRPEGTDTEILVKALNGASAWMFSVRSME